MSLIPHPRTRLNRPCTTSISRTEIGLIEDPEGETYPSLQAAREDAVAKARDLIVEGKQKGENRRGWRFEIMDRANLPVLTVSFAEVLDREAT